jgi:hypothetical protein
MGVESFGEVFNQCSEKTSAGFLRGSFEDPAEGSTFIHPVEGPGYVSHGCHEEIHRVLERRDL